MNPNQLSSVLRQIAARIDNSRNPSRILVAHELRRVLSRVGNTSARAHSAATWNERGDGLEMDEGDKAYFEEIREEAERLKKNPPKMSLKEIAKIPDYLQRRDVAEREGYSEEEIARIHEMAGPEWEQDKKAWKLEHRKNRMDAHLDEAMKKIREHDKMKKFGE